jgi:uncharacterized protein with PIN domain
MARATDHRVTCARRRPGTGQKWLARERACVSNRLLVDAMLGRLVTYLRMCGHDALYSLEEGLESDDAIRERARAENRTVLTRDRELAARSDDALLVESREIEAQLAELADAGFALELPETPKRCSTCNGPLERVPASESTPEHAPVPAETAVWRCQHCGQLFWKGGHWDDVAKRLSDCS